MGFGTISVNTCLFALLLLAPSQAASPADDKSTTLHDRDVLIKKLLDKGYLIAKDFSPEEHAFYLAYATQATRAGHEDGRRRMWSEELFAATQELSPSWNRLAMQKNAVIAMSALDPDRALEMLEVSDPIFPMPDGSIPEDLRVDACRNLFPALWTRNGAASLAKIRAASVKIAESGEYPYPALQAIMPEVAKVDPEQARGLFLDGFTYFQRGSKVASADRDFIEFLVAFHRLLPSPTTREAVTTTASMLAGRAAKNTGDKYRVRVHTEKGIAEFDNATDELILSLISVVREIDADLAAQIVRDRPTLKGSPGVGATVKFSEGVVIRESAGVTNATPVQEQAMEQSRLANVKLMAREKPDEALKLAMTFKDPSFRATALGYVAAGLATDSPERARRLLVEAKSLRATVNDPGPRLSSLVAEASASARLGDIQLLRSLTNEAFELGSELFAESQDAHPTQPAISRPGFRELRELVRASASVDPYGTVASLDGVNNSLLEAYLCLSAAQGVGEAEARRFETEEH